jgi:hypothetical protein
LNIAHNSMRLHINPVGNPAHYARPGPPNPQAQPAQAASWRRPVLSLPLAAGLPPLGKPIGGVCSLRSFRSAPLPPVASPSFHGSKGEEQYAPVMERRCKNALVTVKKITPSGPFLWLGPRKRPLSGPLLGPLLGPLSGPPQSFAGGSGRKIAGAAFERSETSAPPQKSPPRISPVGALYPSRCTEASPFRALKPFVGADRPDAPGGPQGTGGELWWIAIVFYMVRSIL